MCMNYLYLNPNNRIVLQSNVFKNSTFLHTVKQFENSIHNHANGGYFGAPLAIQSVHYDGYHGVL